ncbi:MAG: 50S ribosomal protein L5 [bacterium]|nr:50S ribosomal protein L5 [bacterium]
MARLMTKFRETIVPELKTELKVKNVYQVPRIQKIVISSGIGKILQQQPKAIDTISDVIAKITGQKPAHRKAKKAIAGFKVRQGQIVGLQATLRGGRMYDFLDKLVNVALPRSRDFRGLSRGGLDGHGNLSLGLREHIVFPEMSQEELGMNVGLQVTISTSAKNDNDAYLLLKKFGFPFKD